MKADNIGNEMYYPSMIKHIPQLNEIPYEYAHYTSNVLNRMKQTIHTILGILVSVLCGACTNNNAFLFEDELSTSLVNDLDSEPQNVFLTILDGSISVEHKSPEFPLNRTISPPLSPREDFDISEEVIREETDTDTDTESESENESDSYYDSDDDIDIITSEIPYDDQDKIHGEYYIGIPLLTVHDGLYLLNGSISKKSFFEFEFDRILEYTQQHSVFINPPNSKIEILQLHIHSNSVYEVIIKTHWIRIIQRRWRCIYAERMRKIRQRASIQNQTYFSLNGQYMYGSRVLPVMRGMLLR